MYHFLLITLLLKVQDEELSDRCTILMRKLTSAEAKLQVRIKKG